MSDEEEHWLVEADDDPEDTAIFRRKVRADQFSMHVFNGKAKVRKV